MTERAIPDLAIGAVFDKFRHLDVTTADIEGILDAGAPYIRAAYIWDSAKTDRPVK